MIILSLINSFHRKFKPQPYSACRTDDVSSGKINYAASLNCQILFLIISTFFENTWAGKWGKNGKMDTQKNKNTGEPVNEKKKPNSSPTQDGGANANSQSDDTESLTKVLEEKRDHRKDTKHQLNHIFSELDSVYRKIAEAETRIERMEDGVQNMEQVPSKMIKAMDQQENKRLDQEGRCRREDIKIYSVPEEAAGSLMVKFVCWRVDTGHAGDFPQLQSLALGGRTGRSTQTYRDRADKPRSIMIRFHRFETKKDILGKASVSAETDPPPDSVPC